MTLANRITIVRIALVPLFLAACYLGLPHSQFIAAGIFLVAALSDLLDGEIARRMHQVTTFGRFIDPIADKLLIIAAVLILVERGALHSLPAFIIIGREILISGFRLVIMSEGTVLSAGMLGKFKMIAQVVMVIVLLLDNFPFALLGVPMDTVCVAAAVILTVWSGWDYLYKNWSYMKFV